MSHNSWSFLSLCMFLPNFICDYSRLYANIPRKAYTDRTAHDRFFYYSFFDFFPILKLKTCFATNFLLYLSIFHIILPFYYSISVILCFLHIALYIHIESYSIFFYIHYMSISSFIYGNIHVYFYMYKCYMFRSDVYHVRIE